MATSGSKQYGLILPNKSSSKSASIPRPSIFGDDSDDETSVGESLQKEAIKKKMMKQTRLEMQKALEEDSSVYEYDNVYDDIQKQRLESNKKLLGGADRKPKYINQLMRAVEERKKEQERRDERKIQKEREAEGEKFADKEAYVTSAYRQKLKERQEELEKERIAAEMEAALDVKKQKDLSGFYRHLLNQTVGEETLPDRCAERKDESKDQKTTIKKPPASDSEAEPHSDDDNRASKSEFSKTGSSSSHSKRHYRQRSPSSGSADDQVEETKQEKEKRGHKEREKDRGRDRERDRQGQQKEDRDHRRDRDRHSERDEDRRRERKEREQDKEKDDRKRNRGDGSPKERDRDRNGERQRHKERECHRTDDGAKGRGVEKEKEERSQDNEDKKDEQEENGSQAEVATEPSKFAKRSSDQTVNSARERFLARQMARSAAKAYIEQEED
ncbi:nuclear speckle splicing regulatory protein 1 [Brachyhypopomus gauderio]|uniref:nuclear speckle splicing regulatory protein 1 n=1 Tax=Brachyhypopomus gauderio TaxID=698409 RepID=UPI004042A05F